MNDNIAMFGKTRFPRVMFSLDIETLSTHKYAVVPSIGIASFSLDKGILESKHFLLNYDDQAKEFKRDISTDTIRWWFEQSADVRKATFLDGPRMLAEEAIAMIGVFIDSQKLIYKEERTVVWVKGPHFDASIMETLAEDYSTDLPVKYGEWYDLRTIELISGYKAPKFEGQHNAEIDAVEQAKHVIEGLRVLGLVSV